MAQKRSKKHPEEMFVLLHPPKNNQQIPSLKRVFVTCFPDRVYIHIYTHLCTVFRSWITLFYTTHVMTKYCFDHFDPPYTAFFNAGCLYVCPFCGDVWPQMEPYVARWVTQKHHVILPWNLTWNLKMEVWKMIFLFSWVILRFHVKFQGCNFLGGGVT